MRKYNQKEKRNTIIWLCLFLALGLGIGYAVLTEQLKLNGSVNYGSMAWDVGFTETSDGGGSITSSPTVSQDRKSVTVSCNVGTSTSSETCIAKAKIKNASSFAVQLESNPTITFDNTYINSVEAVWTEDNSPITALNSISAGVEKEIQITITTKELTEDMLPETSLNIPVEITMDWVESTSNNGTQITYVEKQIFPNVLTDMPEANFSKLSKWTFSVAPFAYTNSELFAGKKITKIGIPVMSVKAIDENQKFTIYVVDKSAIANKTPITISDTYVLNAKKDDLGNTASTVNKWIYFDVDIELTENQTLAFGASGDTIVPGYGAKLMSDDEYGFYAKLNQNVYHDSATEELLFDVYYSEREIVNSTIKDVLANKNFSILGDSISTFKGYSNDATNTNDTIGSNAVYYNGGNIITNVEDTWWKQVANETGMNVLVNNSSSGAKVVGKGNISGTTNDQGIGIRPQNLHDNTGSNAGTNPDVIAVYMGINDLNASYTAGRYEDIDFDSLIVKNGDSYTYGTPSNFAEGYAIMLHKISVSYPEADIFVMNMPLRSATASTILLAYNEIINDLVVHYNMNLVDLYNSEISGTNYSTVSSDNLHPNQEGMDLMTNTFVNALKTKYLN